MWLTLSLVTAFFWGVGQVFTKKGLFHISPLWNNIICALLYLVMFIPYALSQGAFFNITLSSFFLLLTISLLYLIYYYALEKGDVSITGTIIATYPVITILLSVLILNERLSFFQIMMICLIIIGGITISLGGSKIKRLKVNAGILYATIAAVTYGIADFLAKVVIEKTGVNDYLLFFPLSFLTVTFFLSLLDKNGRKLPKRNSASSWFYTICGIAFLNAGTLTFFLALSYGQASLVSPISSIYAALTVLLAYIFLKEKVSRSQFIGIIMVVCGIIFIGI